MLPVADEWQLLRAVRPIFACNTPSINPQPPAGSVLEDVIRNFETVFEFEMLQLSDIFPEVEPLALSKNLPVEVVSAMGSLLQVFEGQVSAEAMGLCPDQKIVCFFCFLQCGGPAHSPKGVCKTSRASIRAGPET
jgi:hypothetical protein